MRELCFSLYFVELFKVFFILYFTKKKPTATTKTCTLWYKSLYQSSYQQMEKFSELSMPTVLGANGLPMVLALGLIRLDAKVTWISQRSYKALVSGVTWLF